MSVAILAQAILAQVSATLCRLARLSGLRGRLGAGVLSVGAAIAGGLPAQCQQALTAASSASYKCCSMHASHEEEGWQVTAKKGRKKHDDVQGQQASGDHVHGHNDGGSNDPHRKAGLRPSPSAGKGPGSQQELFKQFMVWMQGGTAGKGKGRAKGGGMHFGGAASGSGKAEGKGTIRKWECNSCHFSGNWWSFEDCKHCGIDWTWKGPSKAKAGVQGPTKGPTTGGAPTTSGGHIPRPGVPPWKTQPHQSEAEVARSIKSAGGRAAGENKNGSWVSIAKQALDKANQQDKAKGLGKGKGADPNNGTAACSNQGHSAPTNELPKVEVILVQDEQGETPPTGGKDDKGKAKPHEGDLDKERQYEQEQLANIQATRSAIELVQGLRTFKGEEGMFKGLETLLQEVREHEEGTKARIQEIQGHAAKAAERPKKELPAEVRLRNLRNKQERRARARERLVKERDEARTLQEMVWEKVRELDYRIQEMEEQDEDFDDEIKKVAAAVAEEAGLEVCGHSDSGSEGSDEEMDEYDEEDDDGGYGRSKPKKDRRKPKQQGQRSGPGQHVPETMQAPALCQQLLGSVRASASPAAAKMHEAITEWMGTIGKKVPLQEARQDSSTHDDSESAIIDSLDKHWQTMADCGDELAKEKRDILSQLRKRGAKRAASSTLEEEESRTRTTTSAAMSAEGAK